MIYVNQIDLPSVHAGFNLPSDYQKSATGGGVFTGFGGIDHFPLVFCCAHATYAIRWLLALNQLVTAGQP